jgi:cation:H+ antiporter
MLALFLITVLNGFLAYYSVKVAKTINVPDSIIIIILLGVIGSIEELFLAIAAIILGYGELVIGISIGVTIAMTLLIGGITSIYKYKVGTSLLIDFKLLFSLNISILLFIILLSDMTLSSTDGILLIIAYVFYIIQIVINKKDYLLNEMKQLNSKRQLLVSSIIVIFILVNMFLASSFVIQQVDSLYLATHLDLLIIAIGIISPFAIMPELIFELRMNQRGTSKIAFSDLITSSITNITLIAGITALIQPITFLNSNLLNFNLFFLAVVALVFNIYAYTNKKIDYKEGIIMMILFFIYLALNFSFAGI